MTGHAEFELDGETVDAPAGTLVFVRPEQRRAATALAEDTTVLVIGGKPGAAGPPSPFEYWYLAEPAYRAERVRARVRDRRRGARALPGQRAAAVPARLLRRPRRAAARTRVRTSSAPSSCNPKAREWAAGDADLAALDL